MKTTIFRNLGTMKGVMAALLIALFCCQGMMAQKKVRIQPSLGGTFTEEDLPKNYSSFNETVGRMMYGIPNKESLNYNTVFNFGDDEIMNTQADYMFTHQLDLGNNKWYSGSDESFLNGQRSGNLYLRGWYYINIANICLAHLDELTDCTAEQKDEIEGDLYFMRAWWHQELLTYFGAMPYVDYELPQHEVTKLPCLTARECAEKCAADFDRAAAKLPLLGTQINYQYYGSESNQAESPNRLAALAYKGKVLLWAASPLNNLGAQTGALANGNTYLYDNDLAKKSAAAFGAALTLARDAQSPFYLNGAPSHTYEEVLCYQNFEGLSSHPFSSLKRGTEQYDADGLWIHNETAGSNNLSVRYIVGECNETPSTDGSYILRVTIKGSSSGSLDCYLTSQRIIQEGTAVCNVPFTEEWQTVECAINSKNIRQKQLIFCSGLTVGDIHIKNVQLVEVKNNTGNLYDNIFYTLKQNWMHPGAKEVVFTNNNQSFNTSNWNFAKTWGPKFANLVAHDVIIHQPTANYINHAYGMANGLPISDPESGFDPQHPFKDRDPRFYNDIVYDGYRYVENTDMLNSEQKKYIYMNLYTGGNVRDDEKGSRTGYFCKKLVPTGCNEGDRYYEWEYSLACNLPYMRLSDIYLMYAEACAAYGSATTSNGCTLTAEDAINVLRDRAGAGHVAQKFVSDSKKFMDEVRRERACELAFEGHRWSDLSRWLLLTEEPYNKKTSQEFNRVGSNNTSDPSLNTVSNWSESVILTRQFDESYYTFPLDPERPEDPDIIYSEDGKTILHYPTMKTDDTFVVPETVEYIGEKCFWGCYNLKNIVLHDGIKAFGAYAFAGTGIKEILLPSQITSLPDYCFGGTAIERFTTRTRGTDGEGFVIPSRIKSLGDGCFESCKFETVTIENGVESLGDYCFAYNNKIKEFNIPASVNHIGMGILFQNGSSVAFSAISAGSLERITVDPANNYYTSVDGVLYDKAMKHLIQCPCLYNGELNVPEGVETIDLNAVYSSPFLTKVILPSTIKSIDYTGYTNFNRCMKLTDIVIKATDTPEWTFNVSNFFSTGITLHVPAESLDKYKEFKRNNGGNVILQVLPIGSERTYDANDLVLLGSKVSYININNPELKDHVKEIYVDGVKQTSTEIPYDASEVVLRMDNQFTELSLLTLSFINKVILPNTVKKLNSCWVDNLYYNTTQLVLPESLEEMAENSLYSFQGWTINIPKNVKTIEDGCFSKACLGEITVDSENMYFTAVDGVLFDKDMKTLIAYPSMKINLDYTVPATVEHISTLAMADPTQYNTAIYPHNTLTLPASLKSIGERAFEAFLPQRVICYAKDVPQIGDDIFGVTYTGYYNFPVYVPRESVEAYKADPQWGKYEILPLEDISGIESVVTEDKPAQVVSIYGLDGVKTTRMRKGVNILRMSNGTAKTVIVR